MILVGFIKIYSFYLARLKEAAIGIGIVVAASICSLLLFVATLSGGRHLILIYCLKNIFTVALGIYYLVLLGLEYKKDTGSFVDKELRIVTNVFFEIIFPTYFFVIAMFYFCAIGKNDNNEEETGTAKVETEKEEI